VYEYDFGQGAAGSLLRHTTTAYKTDGVYDILNSGNYSASTHLRDLPTQVTTYSGGGTQMAQTTYAYDGGTFHGSCQNGPSHDTTYDATVTHRGNATSIGSLLNGSFLYTTKVYDYAGNLIP